MMRIVFPDGHSRAPALCLALGALLLLGGCAGAPRWGAWTHRPTEAQLNAALQWEDQYIYFPGYEIYYNRTQGYYVYRTETGWVERFETPQEVDADEMLASPFVEMSFHDSPHHHHAHVARAFPRTWGQPNPHLALSR